MNVTQLVEEFVLKTRANVFLTGKAGTGKTTLLKKIISQTNKKLAIVAPTGVAAINAGGVTIHSLFQLPPKTFAPTNDPIPVGGIMSMHELASTQKIRRNQRNVIYELELLIIDEISMVRADMMDAIDATLRRIRKNSMPFGGVQLFVIGDLFQLSPVIRNDELHILKQFYEGIFFFNSHAWQRSDSVTLELNTVYRQENPLFVEILNNIRLGIKKAKDLEILNSRHHTDIKDEQLLLLTTHNRKANAKNISELNKLKGKSHELIAKIEGQFYDNSFPVEEKLVLKEGTQVMFIKNHKDGLYYNGLIGRVYKIDKNEVKVVTLEGDTILVEPEEWKNTKYEVSSSGEIKSKELGTFTQFPLKLAWAVTVHKSQGLTFDELIVDLEDTFAAGQLYVALSRCRSLDGLYLMSKISANNIIVDRNIVDYYEANRINESLEIRLEKAKKDFEDHRLISYFDLEKVNNYIEDLGEYIGEKDWEIKGDIRRWLRRLNKQVAALNQVGTKFKAQLEFIFRKETDVDRTDEIVDRVDKGIGYFTDFIQQNLLDPIEENKMGYKSKSKYKTYTTRLGRLEDMIWSHMENLYAIKFRKQIVYKEEIKHKRKQLFGSKSGKPTTHELTLELWNNKYSIEEIAQARELTVGTVESHLGKLLAEDKVKIEDLLTEKRLKSLSDYFTNFDDETLTDVIKKVPFDCSFGELRWVRTWMLKKVKS